MIPKIYEKLNSAIIPISEAKDPPSHIINPDYKEQPKNLRKCVQCGKIHDLIVENTRTGERIKEIDKCKDCLWQAGKCSRGTQQVGKTKVRNRIANET
jgi:hypothetical protein